MMNRWPPSIANRIKVVDISEDFMKAKMVIKQSWLNSAFDKIMFGGTTYSGMDMYYGMALPLILSTRGIEAYVFTKEANIKYLNEGQKLTCELIDSEKGPSAGNLKLVE